MRSSPGHVVVTIVRLVVVALRPRKSSDIFTHFIIFAALSHTKRNKLEKMIDNQENVKKTENVELRSMLIDNELNFSVLSAFVLMVESSFSSLFFLIRELKTEKRNKASGSSGAHIVKLEREKRTRSGPACISQTIIIVAIESWCALSSTNEKWERKKKNTFSHLSWPYQPMTTDQSRPQRRRSLSLSFFSVFFYELRLRLKINCEIAWSLNRETPRRRRH